MAWRDYVYGGGLFGGAGAYPDLDAAARERAGRRGLMTAGANLFQNIVQPGNFNYAGNLASALLAGRDDFDATLDQEARARAIALAEERKRAAEEERIRLIEEKENEEFSKWQMKEGERTQKVHTILSKTGKSFEEINVLDDATLEALYKDLLFPKPEKQPIEKIEGGSRIRVNPDGSEEFIEHLPRKPSAPRQGRQKDPAAEKEKWVRAYADDLAKDTEDEVIADPTTGAMKIVKKKLYPTQAGRMAEAEKAWEERFGPKASFSNVVSGGSSSVAPKVGTIVPPPAATRPQTPDAPAPITSEEGRAAMLVDRYGYDKARQMMLDAGGTVEEVTALLRKLQTRYSGIGLRANPG